MNGDVLVGKTTNSTLSSRVFDVAIIGAGPAGLTAGMYAARAGLEVGLFEQISPGGQLAQTEHIENYPGFPSGINGFELAWQMKQQADRFGVETIGEEVIHVDFSSDIKTLTTSFSDYHARSVIIATGARPAQLGLEFEDQLRGRGVSYCATCDGSFFKDKEVMVVGGGNTAAADVLYLSRICKKVYLVHRRDSLRCTSIYRRQLQDLDNVEFVWNAQVSKLIAEEGMLAGVVLNLLDGNTYDVAVEGLFVAIGTKPNTDFLKGVLSLDDAGYIPAKESGASEIPGVFVAGDVRTKDLRQVVTAISDGANCAELAAGYLSY